MRTVFDPFITLVRGWHVYARQSVVFAGVSLSCLFMTVLALDSVSVGKWAQVFVYGEGTNYRPQTKLREDNIFTAVCLSTSECLLGG